MSLPIFTQPKFSLPSNPLNQLGFPLNVKQSQEMFQNMIARQAIAQMNYLNEVKKMIEFQRMHAILNTATNTQAKADQFQPKVEYNPISSLKDIKIKVEPHEETKLVIEHVPSVQINKSSKKDTEKKPRKKKETEPKPQMTIESNDNLRRTSRKIQKVKDFFEKKELTNEEKAALFEEFFVHVRNILGEFDMNMTKVRTVLIKNRFILPPALLTIKKNRVFYQKYFRTDFGLNPSTETSQNDSNSEIQSQESSTPKVLNIVI